MSHWPSGAQISKRSLSGTLHQRVTGNALHVDGMCIESANLCSGIEGDRQSHTADYTDAGAQAMNEFEILNLPATKQALIDGARALGFSQLGVTRVEIPEDEQHLLRWLDAGYHGEMDYMPMHGSMRSRPQELAPGTVRVLSVRMDYWPSEGADAEQVLADPTLGYVSRYALGRDYHKIMRRSLARLAEDICKRIGPFGYRVCVDSAPVLEKALARNSGLG